jgi:hypothetical protein
MVMKKRTTNSVRQAMRRRAIQELCRVIDPATGNVVRPWTR